MIEAIPRPLVDQEVAEAGRRGAGRPRPHRLRGARREVLQHRVVAGPDLAQEQGVHDPGRVDQPRERVALVFRQRREIGADVRGREARRHLLELGKSGHLCNVLMTRAHAGAGEGETGEGECGGEA